MRWDIQTIIVHLKYIFDGNLVPWGAVGCRGVPWGVVGCRGVIYSSTGPCRSAENKTKLVIEHEKMSFTQTSGRDLSN